jgi:hypothetical protein
MKYLLIIFLSLSLAASAQEETQPPKWSDSLITITATQRFAWWVTKSIQINADNRKLPDVLTRFVGSGTRPDSIFTVTLRAGLIRDGLELILTRPLLLAYNDYRSIMLGQPTISGYTRLDTQIINQANQGRGAAIWLRDWFVERTANFNSLYNEEKERVLKLVQ